MKTLSMAIRNLKNNFSFYALYLISISFVITIFFAFTSFSMNNVMLEKISTDGRVETMCNTISIFLMVFVIFYMAYSNRFFLRRRTKELGIYTLLGYRKKVVLSILTFENILICSGAFIIGVFLGALLHKGIIYGITTLLNLSIDISKIPFINLNSVFKSAVFVLLVVFILALSNGKFLLKTSLMNLIRFENSHEKKMKFRGFTAILGFLLTLFGYILALDILRGENSLWITFSFYIVGMVTFILVVSGTVLFISSFLPYAVQKSKKNKRSFYTDTKIITSPNFIYRIRSNSKTLIMLTLLSASTLTISSVMALSMYFPIAAVSRMAPSEIEFRIDDSGQVEAVKQLLGAKEDVTFIQTDILKVPATSDKLPMEYSLGTAQGDSDNEMILRKEGFECISFSNYKSILKSQGKEKELSQIPTINDTESILIKYQPNANGRSEVGDTYNLILNESEIPLTVKETSLVNPISFANSVGTLIVSDNIYKILDTHLTSETKVLSINGKSIESNDELYEKISDLLGNSPYLQGNSHRINTLFSLNSSTFLLIAFLVTLFFIATGSILYFNNITAISDSKSDYDILRKMGYTNKKIKGIIKKQVLTFFSIPFLLGLVDCIFATIVYKTGLMQNLLEDNFSLYLPVIIALILTALIYLIYYIVTVRSCYKIIFKN